MNIRELRKYLAASAGIGLEINMKVIIITHSMGTGI
jgi:hypothetical protein